jgi:hypothetical protein
VTFRVLEDHQGPWPVRLRCDALGVSPAGYYAWRERPASARQRAQDALRVAIRAIHAECKARSGSPRIHAERAARGHDGCVNTVAQRMRDHGIQAKSARKFRCTTASDHDLPGPQTSWTGSSTRTRPMRRGWRTSPPSRRARLAVAGRRRRPVRAAAGRLVHGRAPGEPPGGRCPGAGRGQAAAGRGWLHSNLVH